MGDWPANSPVDYPITQLFAYPMAKRPSTVFVCQECGSQSPKWLGRCADCGAWNSLVEERAQPDAGADRNNDDPVRRQRRHSEAADEIS